MMIYIHWHKSPDSDTIWSAIAWANYLNDTWIDAKPIALWKINNETKFVLENLGLEAPEIFNVLEAWSKIFLVDHNESSQSIDNRDELKIVWVIDHHKIDNFSTSYPLMMRFEAWGCASSIIWDIFKQKNYIPSQETATLMISAILSDTLHFRSPTTTDHDKQAIQELNEFAKIENLEKYAMDMFDAKSHLWEMSARDIIMMDFKTFEVNWKKAWVWTIETTNPMFAMSKKDEIVSQLQEMKAHDLTLNFLMLSVVDILNEKNETLVWTIEDSNVLKQVFDTDTHEHIADLWKRISRKKDIIPALTKYFEQN